MEEYDPLPSSESIAQAIAGPVRDTGGVASAQLELAESARLRRIAGRMARLGGWRVDLNPTRVTWSPETADIHEERPDFSPDADRSLSYYAPEHRPVIQQSFADCVETGKSFDEVLKIITAKGNRLWVRAIGEAVRDYAGTIVAVEGAFQDISHLLAMRNEADALARRLHQTLESISDAFFLLDNGWHFTFLNGQAEKLLGRGREHLEGRTIWDAFPQVKGSMFETSYRAAVADGRSVRFEEYYPPLATLVRCRRLPHPGGTCCLLPRHLEAQAGRRGRQGQQRTVPACRAGDQ